LKFGGPIKNFKFLHQLCDWLQNESKNVQLNINRSEHGPLDNWMLHGIFSCGDMFTSIQILFGFGNFLSLETM
jgi:hypothetical protein